MNTQSGGSQGDAGGATDRLLNQLLTKMDGMDAKYTEGFNGADIKKIFQCACKYVFSENIEKDIEKETRRMDNPEAMERKMGWTNYPRSRLPTSRSQGCMHAGVSDIHICWRSA